MMKRNILLSCVCGLMCVAASTAHAEIDTATASMETSISADLTLSQKQPLDFGAMSPGKTGGTVEVGEKGVDSTGSVTILNKGEQGVFEVEGAADTAFSISVDQETIGLTGGVGDMKAKIWPDSKTGKLDGKGNGEFRINGTLYVGGGQASGTYKGSYSISVHY